MFNELKKHDSYSERVLLTIFALFGVPERLLDLGSGTGAMVNMARKIGVDALGVDLMATPPDISHDLRQPIRIGRGFDMVICLELAEHLPERSAATLASTIAAHTPANGRLIFSAAIPGQGGIDHLNLKSAVWWRDVLYKAGEFSFRRDLTAELSLLLSYTAGPLSPWLAANVQVF